MIEFINKILNNEHIKIFIIIIVSVIIGYTLHPVPPWLLQIFETSNVFKFFILFLGGITILHPINKKKIMILIIYCILVLFLFELFRK